MNSGWFERIQATGEWWHDPWWESQEYLNATRHPIERVRTLIDGLREVFPADWTKQLLDSPRQNIVMPTLITRGHFPLRGLIRLGETIESVRNKPGFLDVLQRLKGGESNSACWRAVKTDHPCALNSDQAFLQHIWCYAAVNMPIKLDQ